ncbi:hypothetical protein HDU86_006057 [Geranomyces michiganensis]|nr:hypothetical protein HDU86_006057 [Geranomyces michiganensis]
MRDGSRGKGRLSTASAGHISSPSTPNHKQAIGFNECGFSFGLSPLSTAVPHTPPRPDSSSHELSCTPSNVAAESTKLDLPQSLHLWEDTHTRSELSAHPSSPDLGRPEVNLIEPAMMETLEMPLASFPSEQQEADALPFPAVNLTTEKDCPEQSGGFGLGPLETAQQSERQNEMLLEVSRALWLEAYSSGDHTRVHADNADVKTQMFGLNVRSEQSSMQDDTAQRLQQLEKKLAAAEMERDDAYREVALGKDMITRLRSRYDELELQTTVEHDAKQQRIRKLVADEAVLIAECDRLKDVERQLREAELKFAYEFRAAEERKKENDALKMQQIDKLAATCEQIDSSHRATIARQARELETRSAQLRQALSEKEALASSMLAAQNAPPNRDDLNGEIQSLKKLQEEWLTEREALLRTQEKLSCERDESAAAIKELTEQLRHAENEKDSALSSLIAAQLAAASAVQEKDTLAREAQQARDDLDAKVKWVSEAQANWSEEKETLITSLDAVTQARNAFEVKLEKLNLEFNQASNEKELAIASMLTAQEAAARLEAGMNTMNNAAAKWVEEKEELTASLNAVSSARDSHEVTLEKMGLEIQAVITEKDAAISSLVAAQETATKLGAELALRREEEAKWTEEKATLTASLNALSVARDAAEATVDNLNQTMEGLVNEKNAAVSSVLDAHEAVKKLTDDVTFMKEAAAKWNEEKTILAASVDALSELRNANEAVIERLNHTMQEALKERDSAISSMLAAQEATTKLSAEIALMNEAETKWSEEKASLTAALNALSSSGDATSATLEKLNVTLQETKNEKDSALALMRAAQEAAENAAREKGAIIEEAVRAQDAWKAERDGLAAFQHTLVLARDNLQTTVDTLGAQLLEARSGWVQEREALILSQEMLTRSRDEMQAKVDELSAEVCALTASLSNANDAVRQVNETANSDRAAQNQLVEEAACRIKELEGARNEAEAKCEDLDADIMNLTLARNEAWLAAENMHNLYERLVVDLEEVSNETASLRSICIEKHELAEKQRKCIETLETSCAEYTIVIAELQAELEDLYTERDELRCLSETLVSEVGSLRDRHREIVYSRDEAEAALGEANKELMAARKDQAKAQLGLMDAERKLTESLNDQAMRYNQAHENFNIERKTFAEAIATKASAIKELQEQQATLARELESAQQAYLADTAAARDQADVAAAQLKNRDARIAELEAAIAASRSDCESIAVRLAEAEELNVRATQRATELEATILDKEKASERAADELDGLKRDAARHTAELEQRVETMEIELKKSAALVVELEVKISETEKAREIILTELEEMRKAASRAAELEVQFEEAEKAHQMIAAELAKVKEAAARAADLEVNIMKSDKACEVATAALDQARAQVRTLANALDERDEELDKLRNERAALEGRLKALSSTANDTSKADFEQAQLELDQMRKENAKLRRLVMDQQNVAENLENMSQEQQQLRHKHQATPTKPAVGREKITVTEDTQSQTQSVHHKQRATPAKPANSSAAEVKTPSSKITAATHTQSRTPKTPSHAEPDTPGPTSPTSSLKRSRVAQESPLPARKRVSKARDNTGAVPVSETGSSNPRPARKRVSGTVICTSAFREGTPFNDALTKTITELSSVFPSTTLVRPKSLWHTAITHVISPASSRTLKTFAATLKGCWLITDPAWITDSKAAGRWLPEEGYGWRNQAPNPYGDLKFCIDESLRSGKDYHDQYIRCLLGIVGNPIVDDVADANIVLCATNIKPRFPGKSWDFDDFARRIPMIPSTSRASKPSIAVAQVT